MNLAWMPLEQILLTPPLPAAVSILAAAGSFTIATGVARVLRVTRSITQVGVWFSVIAVLGIFLEAALLLLQDARWTVLAVGGLLCAAGLATPLVGLAWRFARPRGWMALGGALALCWYLAALAPLTDGDSLHYHMPVALRAWGAGHLEPLRDLLPSRLSGLGELIAVLGLALGTDNLAAVLQVTGVLLAANAAVKELAGDNGLAKDSLLLLLLGMPCWLFLIPNQKFQALPTFALLTAVLLLRKSVADVPGWAVGGSFAVALSSKYSFYLDAAAVGLLLVPHLLERRVSWRWIVSFSILPLLAIFIRWYRNFQFFGDPVSPLLEAFKSNPDPAVLDFAAYLRDYARPNGLGEYGLAAVNLIIPLSPGAVPLALGIAAVALPFGVLHARGWERPALVVAVALPALFGQPMGRFFVLPAAWAAVVLASRATPHTYPAVTAWLIRAQAGFTLCAALFAVGVLFPGALSTGLRRDTLLKSASGYDVATAVGAWVGPGQLLITDHRSTAFMPALAVSPALSGFRGPIEASSPWRAIQVLAARAPAVFALVTVEPGGALLSLLRPCLAGDGKVLPSQAATRNPWMRAVGPTFLLQRLETESQQCRRLILGDKTPPDIAPAPGSLPLQE